MSVNNPDGPTHQPRSPSVGSDRSQSVSGSTTNGVLNGRIHSPDSDADPVASLQLQLERTMEEKESLAAQYRTLLAKLTTMRTTLGNKLRQDAEELDRQGQLVQQLTAQNDDLSSTVETLRQELITSHEEAERVSNELTAVRTRAFQENAQENLLREKELRETQTELERCRLERDDWERMALQERVVADEAKTAVDTFKRDMDLEREARAREAGELELEREKCSNLQSVLEDFQAAKDHELRQAVKDYESRLTEVTQLLAEFKHRALTAELRLEETQTDSSRTHELEKEVKEKNLLIRKLRHEAVIINEHLIEALRRLRRSSSDTNVDRRLVTNVLLSFLTTPREDAKRFEMLSLLATILSWTDIEREKAGLQRSNAGGAVPRSSSGSFWSRTSPANSPVKANGEEKSDETESFSRLWVEFLLTEAAAGSGSPPPPRSTGANTSAPGSPNPASHTLSFSALAADRSPKTQPPRRLVSSPGLSAIASSPNLTLGLPPVPPQRKGKEKVVAP